MSTENKEHLITLTSVPTETDAAPIVATLTEHGISASMTGGFTAGFIAEAPGDIQIKIFEEDVKRAKEILREFHRENESIDWSQVDVGETEDT
jgi:hypothetical protein